MIRGQIRLARGDATGAVADAERALAHARQIQQAQVLFYLLPQSVYVSASCGRAQQAVPLAHEFLHVIGGGSELQSAVIALPVFAAACRILRLDAALLAAARTRGVGIWIDAVQSYAGGAYTDAADILQRIGAAPDEAEARMQAGEHLLALGRVAEAVEQLQKAQTFYQSAGAVRDLRVCDALLEQAVGRAAAQ